VGISPIEIIIGLFLFWLILVLIKNIKRKKEKPQKQLTEIIKPEPDQESIDEYMMNVAEYLEIKTHADVQAIRLAQLQQQLNDLRDEK
jgi:predicted enzyme involved in methoxymalonyl-ACP biosynthesis|tara:strand:+ start:182 stop:445 length:264 start_codon:yes stop_codon:yes gene_type:complete